MIAGLSRNNTVGMHTNAARRAFSLIELVVVIVIIGIIAAIAIPRMSKGAAGANDSALKANLSILRNAIDMYAQEHDGTNPALATFSTQLTLYSSSAGATNAASSSTYQFGPYMREVPKMTAKNTTFTGAQNSATLAAAAANGIGWVYNETTGVISANADAPANGY